MKKIISAVTLTVLVAVLSACTSSPVYRDIYLVNGHTMNSSDMQWSYTSGGKPDASIKTDGIILYTIHFDKHSFTENNSVIYMNENITGEDIVWAGNVSGIVFTGGYLTSYGNITLPQSNITMINSGVKVVK